MDARRAYCSAVDRNVPVTLKAGAAARDRLSLTTPEDLVCLDYGVRCTGWCCPLFSVRDDGDRAARPAAGRAPADPGAAAPAPTPPTEPWRWARPM